MKDLFRILPKIAGQFEDSEEVKEAVVFAAWKKTTGEVLSAHTLPSRLRKKHLTVKVGDITWKRHLESLSGQLIFKLNSVLGLALVTFIEFQVDAEALEKHLGDSREAGISQTEFERDALEELSEPLKNSAQAIADEELRSQFLLAAGSCLARKRRQLGEN